VGRGGRWKGSWDEGEPRGEIGGEQGRVEVMGWWWVMSQSDTNYYLTPEIRTPL
jgi:hypothetical protein